MSDKPINREPLTIHTGLNGCCNFRLGLNARGWWVIHGARKAGLFRTREAAIKYARDESPDGLFTIVFEPDGLEFGDETFQWAA